MDDNEKSQYWAAHLLTKRNHRQARRSSFDAGWDAALAVFEKVHTPTDDEREVQAINYCPEHGDLLNRPGDGADARSYRCRNAHDIDEIHASFRRSEVQEPSAEEPDLPNGHAPRERLSPFLARRIVDPPDGPTITQEAIALLDAAHAEGRIFPADYSRLHDLISMSEPQGEPSAAQVEAALHEWWYGDHEDTWESKMRAALRAAGGVNVSEPLVSDISTEQMSVGREGEQR